MDRTAKQHHVAIEEGIYSHLLFLVSHPEEEDCGLYFHLVSTALVNHQTSN